MANPGSAPHKPTSAQLTQLATLQTTANSTSATYTTAQATLATAKTAYIAAQTALKQYENYIYGSSSKPGVIDEGGQDIT
jgi:hypothetical protein